MVLHNDEGTPELRRRGVTYVDTNEGKETRRVVKTHDTLDRLLGNDRIRPQEFEAGRKFQKLFFIAGFSRSDATEWLRVPAQCPTCLEPENVIDAKNAVHGAIQALGGHGSAAAMAMWHVVGRGLTLKEYGGQRGWLRVCGALEAGLGVLAKHWGM